MIKHILIISTGYPNVFEPLNGIFQKDQAEAIAKNGIKTGFLGLCPIGLSILIKQKKIYLKKIYRKENNVNTYILYYPNIPFISNFSAYVANYYGIFLFRKYIKSHGIPQIIHIHGYESGLLADKISKKYKIPWLITEHSSKFNDEKLTAKENLLATKVFQSSYINIAVSKSFCELLGKKYNVSFQFIPNLIDTTIFNNSKRHTLSNSVFKIVSIGILNDNKNQMLLLEALVGFSGIKAVIIGEGPNIEKLKEFCCNKGMENMVSFPGFLNKTEIISELQDASCLVITSYKETFGVVAIEAMSMGVPVISTRCGGPESIIIENFNGLFCENNANSLSKKITELRDNYGSYNANNIRDYVLKEFSEQNIISKIIRLYSSLISK